MTDITQTITLDEADQVLLDRHADWWQRKGSLYTVVPGEPLGRLWLPLSDGTLATEDLDLRPDMLDLDRLVGASLEPGPLELEGDRFRTATPYVRVPWVEAILGAPIRTTIRGGSMRARTLVKNWADWRESASHRDDTWFNLLTQLTELLIKRSGGRYAVVQTLMRGPVDLAEAILGPELLSLSLYDHPQELQRFLAEVTDVFIEILQAQLARIPPVKGGYVSPFGLWAPGTVVRTQCDATAFLSAAHYAEWFLPYDIKICEAVDYSIIHLHSCSLHTVDALLAVERPQAIQVTLETGPNVPSPEALLPIFRQILGVKPLILEGPISEEEVQLLQDHLPPDGLSITVREAGW
jgi:hypothetical protein